MAPFDRASETGTGRWHARLQHPAGLVTFDDFHADSIGTALALAEAAYPGYSIEWVVREPQRYGVFRSPNHT